MVINAKIFSINLGSFDCFFFFNSHRIHPQITLKTTTKKFKLFTTVINTLKSSKLIFF